jgi:hypothetical protein
MHLLTLCFLQYNTLCIIFNFYVMHIITVSTERGFMIHSFLSLRLPILRFVYFLSPWLPALTRKQSFFYSYKRHLFNYLLSFQNYFFPRNLQKKKTFHMLTIKSISFFYQEIYGLLQNCTNRILGKTPLIRNPTQVFTLRVKINNDLKLHFTQESIYH